MSDISIFKIIIIKKEKLTGRLKITNLTNGFESIWILISNVQYYLVIDM